MTAGTGTVSFSRADAYNDTASPITIPAAGARRFSYLRYLALYCSANPGTTLSNLRVFLASALAAGLSAHFLTGGQATYTQNNGTQGTAAGNYPADDAVTSGTAPTGYTAMTTSPQVYDATGGVTTLNAKAGKYCQVVVAVDGTNYTGGGNASTPISNITLEYDES